MTTHYLAWWNLENLFSVEDDPDRSEKLHRHLGAELVGWTAVVLERKLDQLAAVIGRMNGGRGPDLLGVCEVENRRVLEQLAAKLAAAGRDYRVVHADAADRRGIDVAFLYDRRRYRTRATEVFQHFVMRRTATRDLLQVNFYTKPANRRLVLIGNHWPSRSGGQTETEPYRIIAAETLAYWHERILEVCGKDQALVVLGDFNDEPCDRSLTNYALSVRQPARVKSARATNPYLWNLMWEPLGQGRGTHFFDGTPAILDQVLVNRPLLREDQPFEVAAPVEIIADPELTTRAGAARRFGRPAEPATFDPNGFSDHLPVAVRLRER